MPTAWAPPSRLFPADMRVIHNNAGVITTDGTGRPLGYCAWDNTSATDVTDTGTLAYLAGNVPGNTTPLLLAVLSPGRNGAVDTTCNEILVNVRNGIRPANGDDFVSYVLPEASAAASDFGDTVADKTTLDGTTGQDGEVRLVKEENSLYFYDTGLGAWQRVTNTTGDGVFTDDGLGNLSYTAGGTTVGALTATSGTFSGAVGGTAATFSGTVTANAFVGDGSGLTNLNVGSFSGTVGVGSGGTGVDASAAANGTLLIGNGTGYTLSTLTAGAGVGVVNGSGTITLSNTGVTSITGTADQLITSGSTGDITLSLPQAIAATSTPTFAGAVLNGTLTGTDANFSGTVTGTFSGNGAALTNLNAGNLSSGTIGVARGGTGVDASAAANGTLLIGNGTGYTLAT
ncbi:MAG: hypothetical protein HC848_02090, partial [Limnobacter sp.]|nr:hypothetical protein [Limnobacter sp.]